MKVEGWSSSTLGDAAMVIMGQSPPGNAYNTHGAGIPLLNGPTEFGAVSPTPIQWTTAPTKLCEAGDILFCVRGSTTGRQNLADRPYCIGRGLAAIRGKGQRTETSYLCHVLAELAEEVLREARGAGSTFPNITRERLEALPVLLPPLPEQRKIAAILSSVDDTIETTQAVIDQLQIVKKAMMQELLTRGIPGRHTRFKQTEIGEVPEEWEVRTLGALGHIVTGSTPSTSDASLWGGDYGFVTPGDMGDERVVSRTERTVTERGLQTARELPRNTIMVTCIGTIGKVGIAGSRCCSNQQINSIICFQNIVPEFVFYLLVAAKPQLLKNTSITAVPIINKGRFEQLLVPLPRPDEQREIGSALAHVDDVISANTKSISSLRELKSALLSVLLTGELRVKPQE